MLNFIDGDSDTYLLKMSENDGYYDFFLTNFKCVWKVTLNESEIVKSIQELNPRIEASHRVLLDKTINLLSKNEGISCIEREKGALVKIESKIGGFPFIFNMELDLMPVDNVYKEITLPLSLMVHELKKRQEKLIAIIKQKDNEIEDYRLGGAQLSHKYLRTRVFDEKLFIEESIVSEVPTDVISCPAKIFDSSLDLLYDSLIERTVVNDQKNMKKEDVDELEDDAPLELSQYPQDISKHSPDLFEETKDPVIKTEEVQKKMPTLLKMEVKQKRSKKKKDVLNQKKLKI